MHGPKPFITVASVYLRELFAIVLFDSVSGTLPLSTLLHALALSVRPCRFNYFFFDNNAHFVVLYL